MSGPSRFQFGLGCCGCGGGGGELPGPGTGTYCIYLGDACSSDPPVGRIVTIVGPGGFSLVRSTGDDGQICFTPPSAGTYTLTSDPGIPGISPGSWAFALTASQSGVGFGVYGIADGYWCPCGCGLVATSGDYEFSAFGLTASAISPSPLSGVEYYADFTVPLYVGGVPTGSTVTVRIYMDREGGSSCSIYATWFTPGYGLRDAVFSGADIAVGSCEPFSLVSSSFPGPVDPFEPWPGPLPSAVSFYEV